MWVRRSERGKCSEERIWREFNKQAGPALMEPYAEIE